ncbi:MAG: CaiB/BaiF CoA-transferase family protein [Myxococcota bacterium]|nr:CaiB/BaiF CoA-transferase family protein [Myxococcota bacterium]
MTEDIYRPRDDETGALDGIRVVDLTIARAGPTCVRQLADLGAEVIRVSAPGREDLRGSDSQNLHRNKRGLVVDLKQESGRMILERLVQRADVFVENFRSDVKTRLGIDYPALAALNPRLIYASLSGFGQTGPYARRPAVDQIIQGMSGLMSVTGPPGAGPWRAGVAISDTAAGTFLAQGVLAALYARERTGRGQWVHTSLFEALVNFMDFQAARWLVDGEIPPQAGNDHPTIFPMGLFETRDGAINIAVLGGWDRFPAAIGDEELANDPRFSNLKGRVRHREELRAIIEPKLRERTSAEWLEVLSAADIACGPVLSVDETFADPQADHLRLTRTVRHDEDGDLDLLRHPVTLSETPTSLRMPPPTPGSETRAILGEHGYSEDEIAEFIAQGVVDREK